MKPPITLSLIIAITGNVASGAISHTLTTNASGILDPTKAQYAGNGTIQPNIAPARAAGADLKQILVSGISNGRIVNRAADRDSV